MVTTVRKGGRGPAAAQHPPRPADFDGLSRKAIFCPAVTSGPGADTTLVSPKFGSAPSNGLKVGHDGFRIIRLDDAGAMGEQGIDALCDLSLRYKLVGVA